MESHLMCEPHNNQHVIQVLHVALNTQDTEEPFIPSDYFAEMKMSTEDRLDNMCRNRKNRTLEDPSPFLCTPDKLIFQNFQLGKWYNATVTLLNKEKSSRCVKIIFEPTVHFRLLYPNKVVWTKVAPGMNYQVIVSFSGDAIKDYRHNIIFMTEEEQFSIPIYAFKPRPLIDFPDYVRLPDVPINMTSEKNVIICNHGEVAGTFNLITTDSCTVCPTRVVLKPKEKTFLKITLKTSTQGNTQSFIFIKFDDDITLKMVIECIALPSTIVLQDSSISFEDTFMGLNRQIPMTVDYHAIGTGYFKWKSYKNSQHEQLRKEYLKEAFEEVKAVETLRSKPLTRMSIINREGHALVYDRIFTDEVEEVENTEEFLFQHSGFKIIPLTGEMGVNGILDFTIIFSPTRSEIYETFAYLEIAGQEERIALKLEGTGLGPEFKLNVAYLEANNIFLRSQHDYEIVVANTGHIPGTLTYIDNELEFGGKIQCHPDTVYVNADEYAAFRMSFSPGEEGKFVEKVEFVINESQECIHFVMTGNVIAPLLNLEIDEIDFGIVAFGYKQYKEIVLCNNSPVPIQYKIEIASDGYEVPVDCEKDSLIGIFPFKPREFRFDPVEGVVPAESKIVGLLGLLPNIQREHVTNLLVHMWGSKNYLISIPVKYDCQVANVVCRPPKLDIKFGFINYVYDRKIVLKNLSDLPCYFNFMPLEEEGIHIVYIKHHIMCIQKNDALMIEVTIMKKSIPPFGEATIGLKIQTPLVGVQELPLYFKIFGKDSEILCEVICNGQGPAICFIPPKLSFGTVTLLDTVTQELEILNDTPIPATINFSFPARCPFNLKEHEKVMPPSSKESIEVSVYLTDPGKHIYNMLADVENGAQVTVQLAAFGEGTSISCRPQLEPRLDLGSLLTYKKFSFLVVLRNEGSRWHKLWISRSDDYKLAKKCANSSAGVIPNYFHLMTNEAVEVKITGSRKEQGYVNEHFYCHAVIEKSHKRQVLFSFEVVARFVDPRVDLSKSKLFFNLDVSSDGVYASLRDKIRISNDSGLSLEIELAVNPPFFIVVDQTAVGLLYLKLNNMSHRTVFIEFHPPQHQKRCIFFNQSLYVNYRDHPKVDSIPIHGTINYPTLSITPQTIDFGCVPLGSTAYRIVTLNNISSLPVIFKWVSADDLVERKFETSVIPSSPELGICDFLKDEQCEEALNGEVDRVSSEDSCSLDSKIRDMLNSILSKEEEDDEEITFIHYLPKSISRTKFSETFNIVPHEACLEPEESLITYFKFTPELNTEVTATVYAHIVGGGNEPVTLQGKCKQISYYLKDFCVDFGKIYFYEVSDNETPLVNNGEGRFTFTVSKPVLPSGWLTVSPTSDTIGPGETFPLTLKCFPGAVGRFETTFNIEVEYLDPASVTVIGFGVYPQIYLPLPRPELANIDPVIAYSAIAELGDVSHACECAREYLPEVDKRILEEDNWVVVLQNDNFPCTMEIDLSIERIWVKYQATDLNLLAKLSSGEKLCPLPHLLVFPYVFDLGCVQINSRTRYVLTYLNYGPGRTVIRIHPSISFYNKGFDTPSVKILMEPNQMIQLHFSFHPTVDKFPDLNTQVTEFLYIDIKNGPRIPIKLKVLVATPTVKVLEEEVDFGSIRCGDCLRKSVNILNSGHLPSHWSAIIDESLKTKSKTKSSFFLLNNDGLLQPGEKFYLRVYFEPHYDDFLSADLVVTVAGNDRQITIQLKGFGMEPFLEIIEERIFFEPTIPYTYDNERFVSIRNASKFPVDFFFPDFDQKVLQDEAMVRCFLIGHAINKVYFPFRAPGDELDSMFQEYYDTILNEIENKVTERRVSIQEKAVPSRSNSISPPISTRSKPLSILSGLSTPQKCELFGKDSEEKDVIVNSYLTRKMKRLTRRSSLGKGNPLPKILPDSEKFSEDPPSKGMLIVFHGAPFSGHVRAAHETGKFLNMPVYTIDRLIINSLLQNISNSAKEIHGLINEAFDDVAEDLEKESSISEDAYDVITKKVLILLEGRAKRKKTKEVKTKAEKQKKKGSGKSSKSSKSSKGSKKSKSKSKSSQSIKSSKSSKKSSKKSKKSSKKSKKSSKSSKSKLSKASGKSKKKKKFITDTLINIPQHLLCELLQENLPNFKQGLIIESLSSNFLRQTMVALSCVLQLGKEADEIYFVIFSLSFEEYLQNEDEQENKNKNDIIKNIDEIKEGIDDMDAETIGQVREKYPEIYKSYILERKKDVIKRRELLKHRKLESKRSDRKISKEEKSKKKGVGKDSNKSLEKLKAKRKRKESSKGSHKSTKSQKTKTSSAKIKNSSKKSSKKTSKKSSKATSKKSSKKSKSSKGSSKKSLKNSSKHNKKRKLTHKQQEVKEDLDTFENVLLEILHTLEFWDKKHGLLTSSSNTAAKRKSKEKKIKSIKSSSRSGFNSTEDSLLPTARPICSDIGIPCWIINTNRHNNIEEYIPNFMKVTVHEEMAHEQQVKYDYQEPTLLQTVLPRPKIRTLKRNDFFLMTDDIDGTNNVIDAKSRNHGSKSVVSLRRTKSCQIQSSSVGNTGSGEEIGSFTYRKFLAPGEVIKYKISFLPKVVGNYKHQFDIGIIGSPIKFTITCVAYCDIPRIEMDPYVLFDRVIECRTERNHYLRGAFVQEHSIFEFGGILLPNAATNLTYESENLFHLQNISRITCDVTFSIKRDSPAFTCEPKSYIIEPRVKRDLAVTAAPLEEKHFYDSLIVAIKNNPKIEYVKLSCYGCHIGIDINPKHVIFERVTLEISLTKDIVITNNTSVEVTWYFVNCEEVLENFKILSFGGKIKPFSFQTSTVQYTAKELQVLGCSFKANVYDHHSRLVYSTVIMVSAETTYLEFVYENQLNYGEIKGWNSHNIGFTIMSKGRYDIHCTFSKIIEEGQEEGKDQLSQYFQIHPAESRLIPDQDNVAVITFSPNKVMTLDKFPVFKCFLIDSFHEVPVKSFEIYISAKVFLSKFVMCPYPEIYFGYQTVGSEKVHQFQIVNKGKFDFNYVIKNSRKEGREEKKQKKGKKKGKIGSKSSSKKSKASKGSKKSKESKKSKSKGSKKTKSKSSKKTKSKSSKRSKSSKKSKSNKSSHHEKKKLKMKPTTLNFGIFSLISSTGNIDPTEEALIEVRSKPTRAGKFEETIIVNVSEPSSSDQNGKLLKVYVTACEPKVNFDEITNIFKEQYVVEKMDDILPENIETKVMFAKSEMKLKFNKVCVNTTEVTRIRIQNIGQVTANVTTTFLKPDHIFTVEPESFSIDPYQTENVMIIYTPNSLDEHCSTLIFECCGFQTVDRLKIDLIGEPCVPEIILLQPIPDETAFISTHFPPTLLGHTSTTDIIVKNSGVIFCKAILEVCFDDEDELSLVPKDRTIPLLNLWDPSVPMKHTNLVNLECEAVAEFTLKFEPKRTGAWKLEVKIHTVNNPFETKTVHIFCEGYYYDVILDGLPCYSGSFSLTNINDGPMLGYSLDYGHVSLNKLDKKCFLITNNSDADTYKFEFSVYNEVIFSPSVGHIRPQTNKQVLAIFLAKTPVQLDETKLHCRVYRINYIEELPNLLSWDDRQHLVTWCPGIVHGDKNSDTDHDISPKNTTFIDTVVDPISVDENLSMKRIEENTEPKNNMVSDSYQNIAIFLSVVANYASFTTETEELQIPDTFVLNRESVNFVVNNTGNINLSIHWSIAMTELPRRINSSRSVAMEEKATETEGFMFNDNIPPRPVSASTLFSGDTPNTNRSDSSWTDTNFLPFTIVPEKAIIYPDSKQTFKVTFAPFDVFNYTIHLKSAIENKDPQLKDIEIKVIARSVLPVYCFELEPSDYLEARRRGKKMCPELVDADSKIIEFESVGLGIISTKKFLLKNPTKEEFAFSWQQARKSNPQISGFHCHTPNGTVYKGQSAEMVFSFIPQECGIFEEIYHFYVPLRDIQVNFLLVGTSREPRIHFDLSYVNLAPTVIGIDVSQNVLLKNEEKEIYSFKFGKMSMLSEGLSLQPTSGILEPNENFPIRIHYHPKKKGTANFDVKCFVEKIKTPLELNIAYTCYAIRASVSYNDPNGKEIQLNCNKLNILNMGAMVTHQKYEITFIIINNGKTGFQWFWDMRTAKITGLIDIFTESSDDILGPKEILKTKLIIAPLIKCQIQSHKIYLKIPYGPTYTLQLSGSAGRPPFKLSFTEYNFGNCLLQTSSTTYYKTMLRFSNYNIFPMTIEKGSHENHISTDWTAGEVPAQNHREITIYFHPLILGQHHLELPLYVDGKKMHITISGKAVPLKLTFVNQADKFVDLGSVLVGQTCTKTVRVMNESECPVSIYFNFLERLPKRPMPVAPDNSIEVPKEELKTHKERDKKKKEKGTKSSNKSKKKGKKSGKPHKQKGTSSKKSKSKTSKKKKGTKSIKGSKKSKGTNKGKHSKKTKSSTKSNKSSKSKNEIVKPTLKEKIPKKGIDYIKITPEKFVRVWPQRVIDFTISFNPHERVEAFVEKVFYQTQTYVDVFCMVKGTSIAPDISLDRYHLTFGNVVVNFERMMNVVLRNTGDVSLKFKWLLDKNEENFSIAPKKGYILPGTDLIFNVFFRPKTVKCWIKSRLICHVDNINKQLQLAVSGSCINVPPPKGTVHFSCPVRSVDIKTIPISNSSNQVWEIAPRVSGDPSFKTWEITRIAPKTEDNIEILFSPMTLHEHNATLCIPTPNGLIVSYTLKGVANPPIPTKITREVLCKIQYVERLAVKNWLLVKQQFYVSTTINGKVSPKNLFTVGGNSLIDVPPNSTRMYDWIITPINEGPLELKVTFTNNTTKEYQCFEISLKVIPNKELDVIEFSTCARTAITKMIKLENPLNVPVVYQMACPKNNIFFEKTITLEPHSLFYLDITYKPLYEEEEFKIFEASCKEMGTFSYRLTLSAHAPVPEHAIMFKTYLGHILTQNIEVIATRSCQFTFDDGLFFLDTVVNDRTLSITFEPNQTGKFQSRLCLKSTVLGEFIYPLIGECCSPKPQGPFLLTATSPAIINFKNPFSEDKIFSFRTEPSKDFFIKQTSETIGPKKAFKAVVNLLKQKNEDRSKYPVTGKLTIHCFTPDISWVYYLQENLQ